MAERTVAAVGHPALLVVAIVAKHLARGVLLTATALTAMTLIPLAFGWRSDVILTGSMEPNIRPGDVVIAEPVTAAVVQPGQVLLVADPDRAGRMLTHRLVARNLDGTLTLKGDANAEPDSSPVAGSGLHGRGRLRVPYIGLPYLWARSGQVEPAGAVLAGFVVLQVLAWRRLRGWDAVDLQSPAEAVR